VRAAACGEDRRIESKRWEWRASVGLAVPSRLRGNSERTVHSPVYGEPCAQRYFRYGERFETGGGDG
jgi:hypothetical protein